MGFVSGQPLLARTIGEIYLLLLASPWAKLASMGRFKFSTLQWVFIALFLLAGLPLLVVSDHDTGRFLAQLAAFFLGGFALAMALDARATGTLKLQHTTIRRATRPWLFGATTLGIGLCGMALVAMAVVMLVGS